MKAQNAQRIPLVEKEKRLSGKICWSKELRQNNKIQPLYFKGRLFVFTWEVVNCLDGNTGELLWRFEITPGSLEYNLIEEDPIIWNGNIMVWDVKKTLYCLDPITGELLWKREKETRFSEIACVYEEDIFFKLSIMEGRGIIRVNQDLQTIWRIKTRRMPFSESAISQGILVCEDMEGWVYAIDAVTGILRWEVDLKLLYPQPLYPQGEKYVLQTGVRIKDNKVFILLSQGYGIYVFDLLSGNLLWRFNVDHGPKSFGVIPMDVVFYDDILLFRDNASKQNEIYLLKQETGEIMDRIILDVPGKGNLKSGLVIGNQYIFSIAYENILTVYDLSKRETQYQFERSTNWSTPGIYVDGKVYFVDETGYVLCFE